MKAILVATFLLVLLDPSELGIAEDRTGYCLHGGTSETLPDGSVHCSCPSPYFGDRCQFLSDDKVESEVGRVKRQAPGPCNPMPCKHGGCYPNSGGPYPYECRCTIGGSYVGRLCECLKGKVEFGLVLRGQKIHAGEDVEYSITVKNEGTQPTHVFMDMGDGLEFSVKVDERFEKNKEGSLVYVFDHMYADYDTKYKTKATLTNCHPEPVGPSLILPENKIYVSWTWKRNLTTTPECHQVLKMWGVGDTIKNRVKYKTTQEFTVECAITTPCPDMPGRDLANEYFHFRLYKPTKDFPTPGRGNDHRLDPNHKNRNNKGQKNSITEFKANTLGEGVYHIHCQLINSADPLESSDVRWGYFEIELEPPTIVIEGGVATRSQKVSEKLILDASASYDPNYSEKSQDMTYEWSCAPKNRVIQCNLGLTTKEKKLEIPPNTFKEGETYTITLHVTSTKDRVSMASVEVVGKAAHSWKIRCDSGRHCERMNPGESIIVVCECLNCDSTPQFKLDWEISTSPPPVKLITNDPHDPIYWKIEAPPVEQGGIKITVRSVICNAELDNINLPGVSTLKFKINEPPSEGTCTLYTIDLSDPSAVPSPNPKDGDYLKTAFSIDCSGFTDPDEPLQYSFYAHFESSNEDEMFLLARNMLPKAEEIYLPIHPTSRTGSETVVEVIVTDSLGLSITSNQLKVQIIPPINDADYPKLLEELILGENSAMKRAKQMGNVQEALNLQLVVLHGIRIQEIKLDPTLLSELRGAMSDVQEQMSLDSFKAIEQAINALYLLEIITDGDGKDEPSNITNLLDMSHVLLTATANLSLVTSGKGETVPTERVKVLVKEATNTAARMLKESHDQGVELLQQRVLPRAARSVLEYDEDDSIPRNYFTEVHSSEEEEDDSNDETGNAQIVHQYATIAHNAYRALENLLDTVGEKSSVGDKFDETNDRVWIHSETNREIGPAGPIELKPNKAKDQGATINISEDVQDVLKSQGISHVQIQVTEVLDNPFFNDPSAYIHTPVVNVILKDNTPGGERLPLLLDGVEKPFNILIPTKGNLTRKEDTLQRTETTRTIDLKRRGEIRDQDIQVYHMVLPYNTRVDMKIERPTVDLEFAVVFLKDRLPVRQDFCYSSAKSSLQILNDKNGFNAKFDTVKIGSTKEPTENYLEYFVGMMAYQRDADCKVNCPSMVEVVNVTVSFIRLSCVFWDEDAKFWSEKGCVVGENSTGDVLHCLCNHASIFAGTQFAIPNKLPTASIFDFKPEDFEKNYILLVTVSVLVILYIIGMIICYVLDRRAKEVEVGITIMADLGGEMDQSYYLVTVLTGNRFGAGTSANVSIQLYGTEGRSQSYVLRDESISVMNRGGIDTFLISSQKDLGQIEKIRIWHDNGGSSPDWFCGKVIVRDVKSDDEWCFFIDKWLYVSGMESTVVYEKLAATEKDFGKFRRRFLENLHDQFDNSHLWLSVFRHPAASRFTRCQRLSCAFGILTSYMLLNIMFYGIELQDPDDAFGLQTYIVACQLTLLAMPFGVLLVVIFRRIREHYIPTLIIWRNRQTASEGAPSVFVPKPTQPSRASKRYSMAFDGAGDRNYDDDSDASCKFSIPSTNVEEFEAWVASNQDGQYVRRLEDPEDKSKEDPIAWGRMGLMHTMRASDPKSFIYSGKHDVPELENMIDNEIKAQLLKSKQSKPEKAPLNMKHVTKEEFDVIQDDIYETNPIALDLDLNLNFKESTIAFETCEMTPQRNAFCYLPWWFIFIAWAVCLGIICTCIYFTLLYGLHYGYLRSLDWLLGIAMFFFMSLFIIQPSSIVISSFLFALFCTPKEWSIFAEERFQVLIKDEDDLGPRRPMHFRVFQSKRNHAPPNGYDIFKLKLAARKAEQWKNAMGKLLFYALLLVPLVVIAYSGRSGYNFQLVNNMRNMLKLANQQDIGFQINSDNRFLEYLEKVLIPLWHREKHYHGKDVRRIDKFDPPVYTSDWQNVLVGVPRIRQVRILPEKCDVPDAVAEMFEECYPAYHISKQDTGIYYPRWVEAKDTDSRKIAHSNDIWKFRGSELEDEEDFVRSRNLHGKQAVYDGGGYVAEFGRFERHSKSVLFYINRSHWIDKRTRGIFVEFTVLNPNINIFMDVIVMVERGPSQGYQTNYEITPVYLSSEDEFSTFPWLKISFVVIALALVFLITILFFNIFYTSERDTFRKLWFWVDILMIVCLLVSLSVALKKYLVTQDAIESIEKVKINEYASLQSLAYWDGIQSAAFSVTQCICFLKIWKLLALLDGGFLVTSLTVWLASNLIIAYICVVSIIIFAFACTGHIFFGSEMAQFSTLWDSFITLVGQSLSVTMFQQLHTTHRIMGPLFGTIFGFLVTFVFFNILLAVLNQSMHNAKLIAKEKNRDWGIVQIVNQIWIRMKHNKVPTHYNGTELQPDRLEGMKLATIKFFREAMKTEDARTISSIKAYATAILKGTGYKIVSRRTERQVEEELKEERILEMRLYIAEFLKSKIGTDMSVEEMREYSKFNKATMELKIFKMQKKLSELDRSLEKYFSE